MKEKQIYGATFSEIGQHSPIAGIKRGVQVLKDLNGDTIVSVGGGSPIDASKLILDFLKQERGGPILTHVAIPTTLSAAEYTVRGVPSHPLEMLNYCVRLVQVTRMRMATRRVLVAQTFHLRPSFLMPN